MLYSEIISELNKQKNPKNVEGMRRFGISTKNALGVSIPALRSIGRKVGRNHELAMRLWSSKIHEARILASIVDDPGLVTERQMDDWVSDFDSWDVCDQCCSNLFSGTKFAYKKVDQWSRSETEFVKRAGYAMMAALSVHDKTAPDERFVHFLPLIKSGSTDERNFVMKAVNWALRQIGKRNKKLNGAAIKAAEEIRNIDSRSARWIASDAIRELTSDAVKKKLSGL